jgi:hypothetical protein
VCAPHLKVQAFVEKSMSIALFALAAVMIVGGIVSVIQGFPFVRLESGLAMTIAGATTASAGAVVLGLAVVAGRLRGLAQALGEARAAHPPATPVETGFVGGPPETGAPQRPRPSLTAASLGAGAGLGAGLGANPGASLGGAASTRPGLEPTFFDPAPPEPQAAEPLLPNLLPAEEPQDRPRSAEPDLRATEDDLFERPAPEPAAPPEHAPLFAEPVPALKSEPAFEPETKPEAEIKPEAETASLPTPEPIALRPSLVESGAFAEEPADRPEPAPEPPAAEPKPPVDEEPQVVGTYASGGNTYVMYSTGVIEADTPRGRFTFGSLDELKAFVEAGGETDSRGAA